MTIKPHLAFAMPVCFLVDRNWRALAAMTLWTLAACAAVTALLGLQVWITFIDGVRHHSGEFFSATNPTFDRSPSMLLFLLRLGAGETLAWSAQILISLASLAMLVVIWRSAEDPLHRAFGLALAICLLNPKVLHYDAAILLIPIAMLIARIERGTAELSFVLLAIFVWCLPYLEPAFNAIGFHPGALVLFAGMIVTFVKSLPVRAAPHSVAASDRVAH